MRSRPRTANDGPWDGTLRCSVSSVKRLESGQAIWTLSSDRGAALAPSVPVEMISFFCSLSKAVRVFQSPLYFLGGSPGREHVSRATIVVQQVRGPAPPWCRDRLHPASLFAVDRRPPLPATCAGQHQCPPRSLRSRACVARRDARRPGWSEEAVEIEIEMLQEIDLVDQHEVHPAKHQWVLDRLLLALGDGGHRRPEILADDELHGTGPDCRRSR